MKRELSQFEQETLLEALTQIDDADKGRKLAEHAAAIEAERAGRVAAESKVGELSAELVRRSEGYQLALADAERKSLQDREARNTAALLATQARAEAEEMLAHHAEMMSIVNTLREEIAAIAIVERVEVQQAPSHPSSYRINVVSRDAAGDLRSLELVPIEKE